MVVAAALVQRIREVTLRAVRRDKLQENRIARQFEELHRSTLNRIVDDAGF